VSTLRPPAPVTEIARQLESRGFETWCVGGAIRDALLGHAHLDWDLATAATPEQVREIFGNRRTIPVGIEFGTVGVLDTEGVMHEVTTFRRDVRTDGRHAEVEFGVSLEDDLARRDFTINAIAYSPTRDELRDPFDGRRDLRDGLVRAVGDASARMREDRLRALRGIRFASRFGFRLDDATLAAIRESAPHLGRLSAERVKQEIEKTLEQVVRPSEAFSVWKSTGAFETLIPALADAPPESLLAPDFLAMPGRLTRRPNRRVNRLAGLLAHLDGSRVTGLLTDLRFSKQETAWVSSVVARWRAVEPGIGQALTLDGSPTDSEVRRWVASIGRTHVGAVMRVGAAVWEARRSGGKPYPDPRALVRMYRRMIRSAFNDPIELKDLAIDGNDLQRAGVPGGPRIGKVLQALLARVLEDPTLNRTDWLLQEGIRLNETAEAGLGGRHEHGD
jgi:tRNA nucleotidyltransferase/poly(A) polymerase